MKGLIVLIGAIAMILALEFWYLPSRRSDPAGGEDIQPQAQVAPPSASETPGSEKPPTAEARQEKKTGEAIDEANRVIQSESQNGGTVSMENAKEKAIDFQYPNGLAIKSLALNRRTLLINLATGKLIGQNYKFFIHVYKKGDAPGVIAKTYDANPSTPIAEMKPGRSYPTIVTFTQDLPVSGGEIKIGLFDEKDPEYAKLKSTSGQDAFVESFGSVAMDPAFKKYEKSVGFQFENGLNVSSVSVMRGMMKIDLTTTQAIGKDYKFFVHVNRQGDAKGTIAMSCDTYPAVPTSQMKPGETYPTVVQFTEELPASGGEIEFGLFDEKDPQYARLKNKKGETQIIEAYEAMAMSPELKRHEKLVEFQFENGLVVKSAGMTRWMMAITLAAKAPVKKDYKFFVHILKKGDNPGVIAKSCDISPTVPTSQMQPGKLYSTIVQFGGELPAEGGEIRYGLFDEKDPQYTKLANDAGIDVITAPFDKK